MERIAYYGRIETGDQRLVAQLLRSWTRTSDLREKLGNVGYEFVYEATGFYLFCHEAGTEAGIAPHFLLEGHIDGTLGQAQLLLQQLHRQCMHEHVRSSLEYVQVDDDGNELSEQAYIR
ncbi:MAG TPA: hypothetical protein VIV60_24760 [Polyangiaceae bacterium]